MEDGDRSTGKQRLVAWSTRGSEHRKPRGQSTSPWLEAASLEQRHDGKLPQVQVLADRQVRYPRQATERRASVLGDPLKSGSVVELLEDHQALGT